jgi:hypothetical protein
VHGVAHVVECDRCQTGFGAGEALAKDRKRARMRVEGFTVKIMIEI